MDRHTPRSGAAPPGCMAGGGRGSGGGGWRRRAQRAAGRKLDCADCLQFYRGPEGLWQLLLESRLWPLARP